MPRSPILEVPLEVTPVAPDSAESGVVGGETTTAASPLRRHLSSTFASATSRYLIDEEEAVEADPSALWAALDLPAPEFVAPPETLRRVVLLGRPLSGKRSLCRRLCCAAEAQYVGKDVGDESGLGPSNSAAIDSERHPLYNPGSDNEEDSAIFPDRSAMDFDSRGGNTSSGSLKQRATVGPRAQTDALPHGSGVSFDYVTQRIPLRAVCGGGGGVSSGAVSASRGATATSFSSLGGSTRRTTEFFCCDNAGALAAALPTLDHVESAVVLMVVDVRDVASIRPQLEYNFTTLDNYVAHLLRTQAPNHDEVRRMQLAAAQRDFWLTEEHKLVATRTSLANGSSSHHDGDRVSSSKDTVSEACFKDPEADLDAFNRSSTRAATSSARASTMRCVIVCTKVEVLERISRTLGMNDGVSFENEGLLERLRISGEALSALRQSRLSLLAFVSQMVRQYAIAHCAALASVCQRVSMATAGAGGDYAGSSLVHPFYRGLWAYIAYILYSPSDANAPLPADVLRICSARMHPYALLPCGLDATGLLNRFVTSGNVQLPEGAPLTGSEAQADTIIRTTVEHVITPDGAFPLHQWYVRQAQAELSSSAPLWGRTEEVTDGGDGMVWDSLQAESQR